MIAPVWRPDEVSASILLSRSCLPESAREPGGRISSIMPSCAIASDALRQVMSANAVPLRGIECLDRDEAATTPGSAAAALPVRPSNRCKVLLACIVNSCSALHAPTAGAGTPGPPLPGEDHPIIDAPSIDVTQSCAGAQGDEGDLHHRAILSTLRRMRLNYAARADSNHGRYPSSLFRMPNDMNPAEKSQRFPSPLPPLLVQAGRRQQGLRHWLSGHHR